MTTYIRTGRPGRRDVLRLGLGAGALSLTAARSRAQTTAKPDVVRIGYLTAARAWVVGKTDGSFDKSLGVKVEWVPFPSGGPALSLLAAKQIDFAIFGNTPIVAGLSRKLPIQILGSPEIVATSERLVAKPGITTLRDLEGRRIAVAPASTMAFALEAVIRINKLDASKIKRLPLSQPDTIAAWKRGDIDATYINGPFWAELLADGGQQLLVSEQLQPSGVFVWNSAVVRSEFAERSPETVVAWLQTVQAQFDRYRSDPEGVSRILAKDFGAPFEAVRDTLAGLRYPTFQDQLGPKYWGEGPVAAKDAPLIKALGDAAAFLAETGEIKRDDVPASFVPAVNYALLRRAFPS
ncbi:glycine betaine ABC transporter substrate-binding protein [Bradyrhizobium tropiciagri]|uniref:taurine ABC transporter substrate-binding protein n=1 Tax=Bradyrhizobium tropiciagri TaxID=312253 RepID=UPI000A75DA83|nr:glycine betaine ABC transporter substrate-binding protein [Bradyrhizobium tropiciagri]